MIIGTIVDEHVSPISAERLWKAAICDAHNLMPKLLPHVISGVEITGGDGGVGTVKKFNFTNVKDISFVKDRIDVIDHENHVLKYSVIEGGLVGLKVKSYVAETTFIPTRQGGCVAKMKIEYESLGNNLLSEEEVSDIKKGLLAMVNTVDCYLLHSPEAYA